MIQLTELEISKNLANSQQKRALAQKGEETKENRRKGEIQQGHKHTYVGNTLQKRGIHNTKNKQGTLDNQR